MNQINQIPVTVITGFLGSGKTTLAKILGHIYSALGFLSEGHFMQVGRPDFIAEYLGQTISEKFQTSHLILQRGRFHSQP